MLSYKQEESCFNIKAIIIITIFLENIIMCTFDYEIIQGPLKQMDRIASDGPDGLLNFLSNFFNTTLKWILSYIEGVLEVTFKI